MFQFLRFLKRFKYIQSILIFFFLFQIQISIECFRYKNEYLFQRFRCRRREMSENMMN